MPGQEDCEDPECRNPLNVLQRVLEAYTNGGCMLWSPSVSWGKVDPF